MRLSILTLQSEPLRPCSSVLSSGLSYVSICRRMLPRSSQPLSPGIFFNMAKDLEGNVKSQKRPRSFPPSVHWFPTGRVGCLLHLGHICVSKDLSFQGDRGSNLKVSITAGTYQATTMADNSMTSSWPAFSVVPNLLTTQYKEPPYTSA